MKNKGIQKKHVSTLTVLQAVLTAQIKDHAGEYDRGQTYSKLHDEVIELTGCSTKVAELVLQREWVAGLLDDPAYRTYNLKLTPAGIEQLTNAGVSVPNHVYPPKPKKPRPKKLKRRSRHWA